MGIDSLSVSLVSGSTSIDGAGPAKIREAAQQFEALLLEQLLRSARESLSDQPKDCATDFAEQQFAAALSRRGGLGLARLIESGLSRRP